jgi:hypothetical protein
MHIVGMAAGGLLLLPEEIFSSVKTNVMYPVLCSVCEKQCVHFWKQSFSDFNGIAGGDVVPV